MKGILTAFLAIGLFLTVGVASASAMLSDVGPHLSSNPAAAKVQVETMLHHDKGVQAFYASESGKSMAEIASAKVINLRFGHCRIGFSKKCPFNTGKDGNGNVVKTDYRFGEVREVAYVELEFKHEKSIELFEMTLEAPCVNLLSPLFPLHTPLPPRPPRPPHIPVSPKKPIVFKLVSTSYSVSKSSSSASAKCPAGTIESVAGSGANGEAKAEATYKVYRQKRHSWSALYGQINSISTTTYTETSTETHVTCTPTGPPPPICTEECEPPPHTPNCKEEPAAEKCKPIVNVETINDMKAGFTRAICWQVEPGVESTLDTIETGLHVEVGETLGEVEYEGGKEFCQEYESPLENATEEYYAWARDTKTHAYGKSPTKTFKVEKISFE